MPEDSDLYEAAEQALLASEGVTAETRFIELEQIGARVRVLVSGEGPDVLLVPGVMTSGAVFAGLVARLSGFRCLMLDRPGTGLSTLPTSPPTDLVAQQAFGDALLADVLDGLELESARVVSTSLGGWFTFRSAAAHPQRFERIVGLAFQAGARFEKAPVAMRMPAPRWILRRRPKVTRRIVRAMLKSSGMRDAIASGKFSDESLDWMVALLRHTDTFANESLYNPRAFRLRGPLDTVRHSPELLGRVSTPVRLLWGSNDLFGGAESAREFASMLPDAEVEMIEGAGHAPWMDEPDQVAASVRRHLSP